MRYPCRVLERVALHQTRFRMPGVGPDARRVLLGQRGLVLFPSLDRLVAFLRACGEEGALDDLLPTMAIHTVVTSLKTRELVVEVAAESSERMDRIAPIARLARGLVFTGTARHFVQYRDAASPLGYDVARLSDDPAALVLYHDTFEQTYDYERRIDPKDLILRLSPERLGPGERTPPSALRVLAPTGVGDVLMGYLARSGVRARVAHVEWTAGSPLSPGPERAHLFDLDEPPARIVRLAQGLPGVHVFVPAGDHAAVELGFRHPVPLDACRSLFEGDAVHLVFGDGRVARIAPAPVSVAVTTMVSLPAQMTAAGIIGAAPLPAQAPLALPLRVEPSAEPPYPPVAAHVPTEQVPWLARLLYALPPHALRSMRMAAAADGVFVIADGGLEGVPLGTAFWRFSPRVYLPVGAALRPAIAPEALEARLPGGGEGAHWFFGRTGAPRVLRDEAFGPVARAALAVPEGTTVAAAPPPGADPPLPHLEYGPPRRFPLWGVPGRGDAVEPREEGEL